ncbi:hypothetical protein F66182_1926 [Fusarium sp. NRRL 66182]|nr:hypothetical protein F66182_1926 [Fusarium sp. NRRL 66182]
MRLLLLTLLVPFLATLAHGATFAELATQLPDCPVQCVTQSIPQSPCDMTNTTCLCTDQTFANLTQACVVQNCSVKESLTLMRIQNVACGVPVQSQQMKFRVNSLVACILAEICVILRIYSKLSIHNKLGPDDYCILIAAFATVPFIYLQCRLADLGFGMNIWDIEPLDRLYEILRLFWIDQILYSVHLYSTKLSILIFLRSIFKTQEFIRSTVYIGVFVSVCAVVTLITTGLQCLPASFNWTSWDGEHTGRCNDLNSQTYAFGGLNMVCDIIILILPLPHLYKLQVRGRQKVQLFVIFSVGIVVTVFSIIRLPFLINLGRTSNPTWELTEVTIWSIWETELGMVCASLPAIRHLFKHLFPNAMATIASKMSFSSRTTTSGNDKSGSSWGDERSLIGKGQETTDTSVSHTNVHTVA